MTLLARWLLRKVCQMSATAANGSRKPHPLGRRSARRLDRQPGRRLAVLGAVAHEIPKVIEDAALSLPWTPQDRTAAFGAFVVPPAMHLNAIRDTLATTAAICAHEANRHAGGDHDRGAEGP